MPLWDKKKAKPVLQCRAEQVRVPAEDGACEPGCGTQALSQWLGPQRKLGCGCRTSWTSIVDCGQVRQGARLHRGKTWSGNEPAEATPGSGVALYEAVVAQGFCAAAGGQGKRLLSGRRVSDVSGA